MQIPVGLKKIIFVLTALFCLSPLIDPPLALLLGLIISQTIGHPFFQYNNKLTKYLLQVSVVGLGFGMNLFEAAKAGRQGFLFTIFTISITLIAGILLGRAMKIERKISYLISVGTAICGGSAIAAVSPIIKAKDAEMSVSLATVFILNSVGLLIFPAIGHYLGFTQSQFGLWAAIAIHDTSSVVGAATRFGMEALKIATTIKLERALWIIPISFISAIVFKNKTGSIKIPYFIFFYVIALAINTYVPQVAPAAPFILMVAKKGLTLTLFLIGTGLTRATIKSVGFKPLILGVILWILISTISLFVIYNSFQFSN